MNIPVRIYFFLGHVSKKLKTYIIMKKMLILLMLLVAIPAVAQVRLGSPLDSIRKEFSSPGYRAQSGTGTNGDIYYSINTQLAKVIYYFDIYNNCYVVQIQPLSRKWLYWYGEKYNREFEPKSDVKWRANIDKVIADIYLTYPDSIAHPEQKGYAPYFTWFFAEE